MSAPVPARRRPVAMPTQVAQPVDPAPVQQPVQQPAPAATAPRRRNVAQPAPVATPAPVAPVHPAPAQFAPQPKVVTHPAVAALVPQPQQRPMAGNAGALAMFANAGSPLKPVVQTVQTSPYVFFLTHSAKAFGNVIAALGPTNEGEPILVNSGQFILLQPFTFILTPQFFQFFGDINSNGDLVDAVPIEHATSTPTRDDGEKYQDIVTAVIIVVDTYDGVTELYPARCEFRGPKMPAVAAAVQMVNAAYVPEWASYNTDNAEIAQSGLPPFCYYTHDVTTVLTPPKRNADGKRKPYHLASSAPNLITPDVAELLKGKLNDPTFMAALQDSINDFDARVDEVNKVYGANSPAA